VGVRSLLVAEPTHLERQRQSCVSLLREFADWLGHGPPAYDQERAQQLRAFVVGFADAEKSVRSWPMDGPAAEDSSALIAVAQLLERALRTEVHAARTAYAAREINFDVLDQVVRGIIH
jgi:hypothetical protein